MEKKKINNKIFTYISQDNAGKYIVEFRQGFPLKSTHLGKTYSKRTQCIITYNNFLVSTNYVTKHYKDEDNIKYAFINSFNPIRHLIYKEARVSLVKQILEYVKKHENTKNNK